MTKQGYTHIIVPKPLHKQLKALAQLNNTSISQLIAQLININVSVNVGVSINTSINTIQQTALKQSLLYALNQQQTQKQTIFNKKNPSTRQTIQKNPKTMGLPGFEPGSRAPEAQSLDQASRQPLLRALHHFVSIKISVP